MAASNDSRLASGTVSPQALQAAMTRIHEDNILRRAVSAAERARYLEAI